MVCQTHRGQSFWTIPDAPVCKFNPNILGTEHPVPGKFKLFKYNDIEYRSKAWHCKKIRKTVSTFTYFFGDIHLKRDKIEDLVVSQPECELMLRSKKTTNGEQLVNKGGLWQTNGKLDWQYSAGGARCCWWKDDYKDFYYLYETEVFKRFDATEMTSSVGLVSHCHYDRSHCQLNDLSALIWTVNKKAECKFLPWKTLTGQIYGNHWVSDEGDLALTWDSGTENILKVKCQTFPLIMSHQGIPFRVISRSKREINRQTHGWISSEQLASELQAIQENIQLGLRSAFKQAMTTTCQNMVQIYNILRTLLYANPVNAARILLNNSYIYARTSANTFEVFPCTEIKPHHIRFLSMNNSCTKEVPILYSINTHRFQGFLDVATNIIIQCPTPIDCNLENEVPLFLNNTVQFYERKTGAVRTPSKPIRKLSFYHPEMTTELSYKPIIYHELVMYNLSEIRGTLTMNDVFKALQYQHQIYQSLGVDITDDSSETAAHKFASGIAQKTLYGFLLGFHISYYSLWLFLVAVYVTGLFIFLHCCPGKGILQTLNIWPLLDRIRQQYSKIRHSMVQKSPENNTHTFRHKYLSRKRPNVENNNFPLKFQKIADEIPTIRSISTQTKPINIPTKKQSQRPRDRSKIT